MNQEKREIGASEFSPNPPKFRTPPLMMNIVKQTQAFLDKPYMPIAFFFGGITFDHLTLTRIDRLQDNLLLLLYVSLLGTLIILVGRAQFISFPEISESESTWSFQSLVIKAQPYYVPALHFLFGSLFSAYAILYSKSASLNGSAIFLGIIVVMLVVNEFLHKRFTSVKLLMTLYALVTFSFFTFFLPVVTGYMNTGIFLLGVVISIAVVLRVVHLTYQNVPNQSPRSAIFTGVTPVGLIILFTTFYFLNWIPPVPLSLKFAGMYHQVEKVDGDFRLTFKPGRWYEFFKESDDILTAGEPAYCFTAVFAPVNLDKTIYHHWQYRPYPSDETQPEPPFTTTDRIPITISGGREAGYRSYTMKQKVDPGDWLINVETDDGKLIGTVSFEVKEPEQPIVDTKTY